MAVKINRGGVLGGIDLTPMIDMVFNLLIFFMVVSQFASAERDLKVVLPEGSEAMPLTVKPKEIFVNVDKDGRYFIRGREITEPELQQTLVQAAVNNASQSVIIRADKRAAWDYVATAMRLCNQAGIRDYSAALSEEP